MSDIGTPIELSETSRTYLFPGGDQITLSNVIELVVRPSGDHRIKTKNEDGIVLLHIIPKGWLAVTIEDQKEDWTV